MTLPVVPIHDPVAHPEAGSDLPPAEVAALEREILALAKENELLVLVCSFPGLKESRY
jgi:quinolinate synthase